MPSSPSSSSLLHLQNFSSHEFLRKTCAVLNRMKWIKQQYTPNHPECPSKFANLHDTLLISTASVSNPLGKYELSKRSNSTASVSNPLGKYELSKRSKIHYRVTALLSKHFLRRTNLHLFRLHQILITTLPSNIAAKDFTFSR